MKEAHKRVIVEHQNRYARDFRYVPAGQTVWGNCATFATTAALYGAQGGHPGKVIQIGPTHVAGLADGWVFDSTVDAPMRRAPLATQGN